MSSDDVAAEVADIAYNLELSYVQNSCMVATAALLSYEYLCTLPQELDVLWNRRKTGATILFLLNRFATAGFGVAMMLIIPNYDTVLSCKAVNLLLPCSQLLLSTIWAAFSALRVFAISSRDWRIASSVFMLDMVPVGTNLASDIRETYDTLEVPFVGTVCNLNSLLSAKTNITFLILTRSCIIAADVIVLVVTWRNTYNIQKEASVVNLRTPTITLLLRDGTMYFTLLLILNVLHLALEITDVFWDITYFVTGFSSIVISRFLLNLRQVHADEERDGTQPSFIASHVSGLNFASTIIGNLGEHLDHGNFVTSPAEFQHSYGETEGATGPDDLEIPREQWPPGSEPFEEGSTSSPTQSDEIHTLA